MRHASPLPALLLAASCLFAPAKAKAQNAGETVRNALQIGQKQVPLPRGDWIVAGTGVQPLSLPDVGAYGAVRSVILAQVVAGKIAAIAEVNSNLISVADGWGYASSCVKGDQFLLVTRYRTGFDLSCFFVAATPLALSSGPEAWANARAFLSKAGLALPETALTAGFRASDRQDVIDMRLHFNPALLPGVGPREAGVWTSESVKASPAQRRAVEILTTWALGNDGWIDRALGDEGAREPIEPPQRAAILSETPLTDRKLADLETLYNRGAIDIASLTKQEEETLSERPVLSPEEGTISMSARKNISYRVFSAALDYMLAFAVTLSASVSTGVTASIIAIHSVIFAVNDAAWDDHFAKAAARNAKRAVDFEHIGKPKA